MSDEITLRKFDQFAEHSESDTPTETHIEAKDFSLFYGDFEAVRKVSMQVPRKMVTSHDRPQRLRKKYPAALHQPDE